MIVRQLQGSKAAPPEANADFWLPVARALVARATLPCTGLELLPAATGVCRRYGAGSPAQVIAAAEAYGLIYWRAPEWRAKI
ncbi:MAG: hypothetical protein WC683_06115 [bacterium]